MTEKGRGGGLKKRLNNSIVATWLIEIRNIFKINYKII